ncbi:hypothetical protein [Pseudoalteromonas sp. S16_S37]|uniref:hypothetical protein n=1 Tax=Pseudoalteromonas sp. S16_S37 TaxID=2720228 RepID=UPI001680CB64|nr:hypothetical protein [Pseudoalteromonas sp. S16_S37]MBD1583306.1 hypothetical protein [Pseudoalteromonas sp. S16_S37]
MLKKILIVVILVPIMTAVMMLGVGWWKNDSTIEVPVVSMIKLYPKKGSEQELAEYMLGFSKVSDYVISGSLFHLMLKPSEQGGPFIHLTIWRSRSDYHQAFKRFAEKRGNGEDHIKNFPHHALAKPFEYEQFSVIGNVKL